ncbi:MAG: DUF421 domain-containing protein [Ignavibacteriales bacterium]|nr:DUF421 domain-containing protein [Ignavibacteriales bacterium]MBI3787835.1 DUF421 domain-containing protein [Ignavibacteriales bacterium]
MPNLSVLLEIALRTLIIYVVVLVGIRLTGKREVGQMTPFDLVLLLLIANAVQNAMTGPDTSVLGGIVAAATLLLLNASVTRIVWRYRSARKLVEGSPTLLIRHGKVLHENLAKEKIPAEALHQALREHGIANVGDVSIAVLEIDGSISVLKNEEIPSAEKPHRHIRFLSKKGA